MQGIYRFSKLGTFAVLAVALTLSGAGFAQDVDPAGKWDITVDMGGTPMTGTLEIVKNDDGTYSGTLSSPMGDLKLDHVEYTPGESIGFNETVGEGDTAMEFKFEGKFTDDNTFSGLLETSMGPMEVKAKRASDESPIAGTWNLVSESQLGTLKRDLVVYKSGEGKYVTEENSFAIENLAVEADAVTFDVTLEIQGQELALAFKGTYLEDSLTGQFMLDGTAAAEVSGTKAPAAGIETIAGDWDMTADTPLGEVSAKLTLAEDGSTLSTDEGETEVTNIDIDSDFVKFDVVVLFEGAEYEVTFEGFNKGKTLEGDFVMAGAPVATVFATRAAK